jgi:hypothetical protein
MSHGNSKQTLARYCKSIILTDQATQKTSIRGPARWRKDLVRIGKCASTHTQHRLDIHLFQHNITPYQFHVHIWQWKYAQCSEISYTYTTWSNRDTSNPTKTRHCCTPRHVVAYGIVHVRRSTRYATYLPAFNFARWWALLEERASSGASGFDWIWLRTAQ